MEKHEHTTLKGTVVTLKFLSDSERRNYVENITNRVPKKSTTFKEYLNEGGEYVYIAWYIRPIRHVSKTYLPNQ